jgi:hypothetical protein
MHVYTSDDAAWSPQVQYDSSARFMSPSSDGTVDDLRVGLDAWQYAWDYAWQSKSVASSEEADADVRQVVRKATIELKTTDVRAVFLKAGHLVEEAMGEFVQDSALTGTDQQMQANLTLRVDAQRLPELLNELRGVAEVVSERVGGQDVTSQVVDLEARLRNETRVEQELLELMDKRADAPLKEVLALRSHLSNVRQSIEQLTAQRDHLGRLVSLATVLVIIRGAQAEPPKPDGSIGAYFFERMRAAWLRALVFLVDTAATIVSVLVGGILWWVLLVAAIVGLRRYLRRRAHQV